jgi:hypothetical protein
MEGRERWKRANCDPTYTTRSAISADGLGASLRFTVDELNPLSMPQKFAHAGVFRTKPHQRECTEVSYANSTQQIAAGTNHTLPCRDRVIHHLTVLRRLPGFPAPRQFTDPASLKVSVLGRVFCNLGSRNVTCQTSRRAKLHSAPAHPNFTDRGARQTEFGYSKGFSGRFTWIISRTIDTF